MAGATDCYRVGMNARTQWTSLPGGAFNTTSAFIDMNYSDIHSGFGLLLLHDNIGTPNMASNEVHGFYSYYVPVSKKINLRFGLEGAYASRSLNYSQLIFEDQFTGIDVSGNSTGDIVSQHASTQYGDVSSGLLVYDENYYWFGFSAHHLTEPLQGFYQESKLPMKLSLHGGYNIYFKKYLEQHLDEAIRITPTFIYKSQSRYDQLDVGFYVLDHRVKFGLLYRGIAFKGDFEVMNKDAFNFQLGYQVYDFQFGYSYDWTISNLNQKNTAGSHEISLMYLFCADWPGKKRPSRNVRRLPCPSFRKSRKHPPNKQGY